MVLRVIQMEASEALSVSPSAFSWELQRPTQSLGNRRMCVVTAISGKCSPLKRSLWARALRQEPLAEKELVGVAQKGDDGRQRGPL